VTGRLQGGRLGGRVGDQQQDQGFRGSGPGVQGFRTSSRRPAAGGQQQDQGFRGSGPAAGGQQQAEPGISSRIKKKITINLE
jgi:hypothetical protein